MEDKFVNIIITKTFSVDDTRAQENFFAKNTTININFGIISARMTKSPRKEYRVKACEHIQI